MVLAIVMCTNDYEIICCGWLVNRRIWELCIGYARVCVYEND